jgi:hypothetical protein
VLRGQISGQFLEAIRPPRSQDEVRASFSQLFS